MSEHRKPLIVPRKGGKWATFIERAVAFSGPGCLIWPYAKDRHGYGVIEVRGQKNTLVHRIVCQAIYGPAPDGMTVCAHSCGITSCIAPQHLRWTTQHDNIQDRIEHGTVNRGTRNGGAKLNEKSIRQIRALHAQGLSCAQIAQGFPVNSRTINKIVLGQKWAWL